MHKTHTHADHRHTHGEDLGSLLIHCSHYLAHRIGGHQRGQDNVLHIIEKSPGVSQKQLADILQIKPASVSELLMKLEHKGLILRSRDDLDRRSIKVRLTEEGQIHLSSTTKELTDPFQGLSVEEQAQLRSLLGKLLVDWEQRYTAGHRHHAHKHHKHDYDKEKQNGKHE